MTNCTEQTVLSSGLVYLGFRWHIDFFCSFSVVISFFPTAPEACGSSWARDQTCTTVVTCTTGVAMLDP